MKSRPTISFQGAPGAFSHGAGKIFAHGLNEASVAEFVSCRTFDEMFDKVAAGGTDYGVVPLENSSIGSITANFDLIWVSKITIVGEISMPVHHQLIGLFGADIGKLTEVYSHPAALDQCRKLFNQMPHVRPSVYFDTSGAVRFVSEAADSRLAAIAGEAAAEEHGLVILKRNIEDYSGNTTRFGIITKLDFDPNCPATFPELPYKISCAFELPHKPGSLAQLLQRLAALQVNLTKIESRPIPEAAWHYRFFLDMELDSQDKDKQVVNALKDSCETYKIFGRYKSSKN